MIYKLFAMSGTEEPITEESVKALRADYAKLQSNHEKLIELTEKLAEKKRQIDQIDRKIKNDLCDPIMPSVLNLNHDPAWDQYLEEADEWIQEKKDQDKLKEQIKGLEKERKDFESQIVSLVPPSFHGKQIIVLSNQLITVNDETVKLS